MSKVKWAEKGERRDVLCKISVRYSGGTAKRSPGCDALVVRNDEIRVHGERSVENGESAVPSWRSEKNASVKNGALKEKEMRTVDKVLLAYEDFVGRDRVELGEGDASFSECRSRC